MRRRSPSRTRPLNRRPVVTGLLFLVLLLALRTLLYGGTPSAHKFDNSRDGFTISLPENWVEISSEKIAAVNQLGAQLRPEWKRPIIHYAYQTTNSEGFSFPPFIMVRVVDAGQPPDLETVRKDVRSDAILGTQWTVTQEPAYDPALDALVFAGEFRFPQITNLVATYSSAYYLTKTGAIKVHCCAAKADSEKVGGLFQQVFQGVRIKDEAKYRPPGLTGLFIAIASIVVIVIVLWRAKPAHDQSR